jgi:hypothetical protein
VAQDVGSKLKPQYRKKKKRGGVGSWIWYGGTCQDAEEEDIKFEFEGSLKL